MWSSEHGNETSDAIKEAKFWSAERVQAFQKKHPSVCKWQTYLVKNMKRFSCLQNFFDVNGFASSPALRK